MDGRRDAFETLFAHQHAAVLRFVERRVDDREQARELTMDCFEIAWRRFDPDAPFRRPWLLQTARNLVGDFYRKRDRERDGIRQLATAEPPPDATFENIALQDALGRLPQAEREILQLFYWDGLSAAEIAEVVRCRTATAWKRLSRARESLRAMLADPPEQRDDLPTRPDPPDPAPDIPPPPRGGLMPYVLE